MDKELLLRCLPKIFRFILLEFYLKKKDFLKCILLLFFLAFSFSCNEKNERKEVSITIKKEDKKIISGREKIVEQEKIDSLRLDNILKGAIKIATENILLNKFHKEYLVNPNKEYFVAVEINSDYYFTNNYSHTIIRRVRPGYGYIDIYSKTNNKLKNVMSYKTWDISYTNDTIQDINGDNLNDFVVNWFGTGCCLKSHSDVYLLRDDKQSFSKKFEFINPTFSSKEKTIRGVCYGQPGETEMYKYKWNGENIDTLEYVFFERNNKGEKTGNIISSNSPQYTPDAKIKKTKTIPIEYKSIEGYDWFTGEVLENIKKNKKAKAK